MKKILSFFILLLFSCGSIKETSPKEKNNTHLSDFVNPFIGTGGHGHTYPGISLPFGMVQLSPDTRIEGWDGCGGYHYSDNVVYGFSHTHLSGTGVPDYGDVLVMPTTGEIQWNNGYKSGIDNGYASRFSHQNEEASPGYYSTVLDDYAIIAELTATTRVGFHKYTFPKSEQANIIVDLLHRDRLLDSDIEVIDDHSFQGKRISKAWASEQHIYFYGVFSKAFSTQEIKESELVELDGSKRPTQVAFTFKTTYGEEIMLKIGISAVSTEGAKKNLKAELNHWNFEQTKNTAKDQWDKALNKIVIETPDPKKKTIFYTALYHSLLNPNTFMDVDGQYRGTDLKIHEAKDFTNYTVFSLWDTYRAAHPLYTIIEPKRTKDFIKTFLHQYQNGGQLPVWELAGNYTGCMIGYHSVSVIADAYAKGIRGFDEKLAMEAMKHSAIQDHLGLDALKENGYISSGREPESVSKTLEYAYDDWCIAQFAKAIGNKKEYQYFLRRGQYYKNIFDPTEGFMRAKSNNQWFSPFDPAEVNFNYTEANSWQYSFAAPQDIEGMIRLYGGKDHFEAKLDALFEAKDELSGRHQVDITGLIGQYAHGNEPSHHIAYLYNYIEKPWKTQERIDQILGEMYHNAPDGLSGNEDCGQMSAWYVLSALGFYPVTPGIPYYTIGVPAFSQAAIQLENGKTFIIKANHRSPINKYIQSATLNGQNFDQSYIAHQDIIEGGELVFEMGSEPNKNWGKKTHLPAIKEWAVTSVPYLIADSKTFTEELVIKMETVDADSKIYYTLDGSPPSAESTLYKTPITIKNTTKIRAVAQKDGILSFPISSDFFKIQGGRSIELKSKYANQYAAGGDNALIDYLRGEANYRTGAWQGYQGQDFEAIVDLGEVKPIHKIEVGFLQDIKSWIWYPTEVSFEVAKNKGAFKQIATVKNTFPTNQYGAYTQNIGTKIHESARYIRVKAKNFGKCPDWHLGAGGDSWQFIDEIVVE